MRISKVFYKTEDNVSLTGLLHMPEETKPITVVISTHGITSNCLKYRDDVLAKLFTEYNIAYFAYNNRGHDIINADCANENSKIQGSAVENITDSYYDIKATIKEMLAKGFKRIILQGHSLGCTKTVFTYNKLLEENHTEIINSIYGISLLSMVNIPGFLKLTLGNEFEKTLNYVKSFNEKEDVIIEVSNNFPPIRPRTALNYIENKEIDFFDYTDQNFKFEILNKIKAPLFMRWGNVNELISIDAKDLVKMMNEKIENNKKDINYIDGANHNYSDKEDILAKDILNWMTKYYLYM